MLKQMICQDETEIAEKKLMTALAMAALDLVECNDSERWGGYYLNLKMAVQDCIDANVLIQF